MKYFTSLKVICSVAGVLLFPYKNMAQDATAIADANSYLQAGAMSLNNRNYTDAINNLLVSVSQAPSALAYYLLSDAYAKNGDPQDALQYSNTAINTTPPLDTKYYKDLIKIRDWASAILNSSTTYLSGDALKNLHMDFDVSMPSGPENPFTNSPAPDPSVFVNRIVYSTSEPQYSASVVNNTNTVVGYIVFFGFTNGRNINGQTVASTFSIPLRRVIDNSNMEWGNIMFKSNELYAGSVKTESIGNLTFKAIILSVQKYDPNNYYLNSLKIQVDVLIY